MQDPKAIWAEMPVAREGKARKQKQGGKTTDNLWTAYWFARE